MSRCFPYPPPGYTLSSANEDLLIESIKLQKEREKSKDTEQKKQDKKREKEKKKEKRERKKEKKDKANRKLDNSDNVPGHIGEKLWANTKSELLHKRHDAEPDQLEQSSLTEEHGHAVCSNPPSCSSDSTENSNKRKRQYSPEDVNRVHGKIIRIKLSKKLDDFKSSINEQHQQHCSASGRPHFPCDPKNDVNPTCNKQVSRSTPNEPSKIGQVFAQRIDRGQIQSTSQQIKTVVAIGKAEVPPVKSAVMTPMQKVELQYRNLFENWALPQLQDTSLPDDLDWMFQGKNQDSSSKKKPISGNGNATMPCSGSQDLWPCSHYLREVDVYALPYTVPF